MSDQFEEIAVSVMIETQGRTWAILRDFDQVIRGLHGVTIKSEIVEDRRAKMEARAQKGPQPNAQGVALINLTGVITPKASLMDMIFGDGSGGLQLFRNQLKQAVANPDVGSIVLNVDSPGGIVDLVPETAAEIREARDTSGKPIVAVANTMIASAAYWLAAQAHEVVISPSGIVGSVGVYQMHEDISGMAEKAGVNVTFVQAGAYKTEGNQFQPLVGEALAHMQEDVNDYYGMFVKDVAAGRGVPVDPQQLKDQTAFGGARTFTASKAKAAGLVDRVATLDQTISRLSSGRAKVRRMDANADMNTDFLGDSDGEAEYAGVAAATYTPEEKGRLLDTLAMLR